MENGQRSLNRQNSEYGSTESTETKPSLVNSSSFMEQNGEFEVKSKSILPESRKVISKFSISEPQYQNLNGKNVGRSNKSTTSGKSCGVCCFGVGGEACGGGWHEDGLRMIILSMFIFSIAVTAALVIDIASSSKPKTENPANKVISDVEECNDIGTEVMNQGGNAVDAAVASGFCLAVYEPHITSIGGGGMMLLHRHRTNKSVIIDFRETVPENSNEDRLRSLGRWSVGVPGFVKGLWHAHKKYGSGHDGMECCAWTHLIQKTIHKVVRHGVRVTSNLVAATNTKIGRVTEDTGVDTRNLREFVNSYGSGESYNDNLNHIKIYKKLIRTLKTIASNGADAFYEDRINGSIAQDIVKATGGAITPKDLKEYKIVERDPIVTHIGKFEVMASGAPSSGPELLAYLNTLEIWYDRQSKISSLDKDSERDKDMSSQNYWSTVIDVMTKLNHYQLGLGDPTNNTANKIDVWTQWMINKTNTPRFLSPVRNSPLPFEAGYKINSGESVAGQVMVMDKEDNYVSMVTSLNTWFGSKIMTDRGILLNNALGSFAPDTYEGHTANTIVEKRRPLTRNVVALSMDIENICGKRILVGGATSAAVGTVLSHMLFHDMAISDAIDAPRVLVRDDQILMELAKIDPKEQKRISDAANKDGRVVEKLHLPYSSVNGLEKWSDTVLGYVDGRNQPHIE